jgi:hypothetical protein
MIKGLFETAEKITQSLTMNLIKIKMKTCRMMIQMMEK